MQKTADNPNVGDVHFFPSWRCALYLLQVGDVHVLRRCACFKAMNKQSQVGSVATILHSIRIQTPSLFWGFEFRRQLLFAFLGIPDTIVFRVWVPDTLILLKSEFGYRN